jgi:hypothetical protein
MDLLQKAGGAIRFAGQKVSEFQQGFKEATSFLDPVEDVVTKTMQAESKLPSSRAVEGAQILAERANVPSVLIPLLGIVSVGGGIRLRKTKVGKQFPEVAESASKYMDEAEAYLKQKGSLEGYPRFVDPAGAEHLPRPKGTKPSGEPRLALSPMSVKQAYTNVRKGRDVTSDEFEKFQRQQFNQMVKQTKSDTMVQYADMPSYVEHNRRLSSPFWKTARAKGQKAGDVDNLSQLFDLEFKTFKDNVDKALDRITDSPIDAYYDPLVDSIVVENIKTGKQLGYLDQTTDIKTQLNKYIQKVK